MREMPHGEPEPIDPAWTAHGIVAAIAAGERTAEEVAEHFLARIAADEPAIRAFAHLDPALVLAQARAVDRSEERLPLRGVPFAVKDIIDTADQPTECNSPIYRGRRPAADAECVGALRAAGAVVIGKAVTTEFAGRHPGPTRNPLDLDRTPGGSSSGSAAAVAAGFAPLAFGTQTGGSVIRPAAYCGTLGYKATLGALSVVGVKPLWLGFDALGIFARTPGDLLLCHDVLAGSLGGAPPLPTRPRIAAVRSPAWPIAEPAMREALLAAAERLSAAGVTVEELALQAEFDALPAAQEIVSTRGIAHSFTAEWAAHRDQFSPSFAAIIERGLAWPEAAVARAWATVHRCGDLMAGILARTDALLTPAAPGEAPRGLADTGDAAFNVIWSLLGTPALSLPLARGPSGMPLGLQLVAARGADRRLIALGERVLDLLGAA